METGKGRVNKFKYDSIFWVLDQKDLQIELQSK